MRFFTKKPGFFSIWLLAAGTLRASGCALPLRTPTRSAPAMKSTLALFLLGASAAFAQQTTPTPPAPTPDGPATYTGRGPTLPAVTENISGGPTPAQALLVGEKGGGLLSIIDPDKLEIVARVVIGGGPHEVATDGRNAYVSSAEAGALVIVDVKNQTKLPSFPVGALGTFHGLWEAGGHIYIGHENTRLLSRYDPATQRIDWTMGVGYGSHLLIVTPDEKTIYLASGAGQQMAIWESPTPITSSITVPGANRGGGGGGGGRQGGRAGADGAAGTAGTAAAQAPAAAAPAPAGTAPTAARGGGGGGGRGGWAVKSYPVPGTRMEGLEVSPDGKEFWGVNVNEKTITVVSIPENRIIDVIKLETGFTNRVKLTLDGKYALINELMGPNPKLIIYDAKTRREIKRLDPGAGGEGIYLDPRGKQAFYAVSNGNKIAVIDLETLTIKKYIEGLRTPDGMAWYTAK
jgi:DNA-binding beta-propeller fold protein YncE